VQIRLLPDAGPPLELKLEIGNYVVNQLLSNDPQMFAMPAGASKTIDLAELAPAIDMNLGTPAPTDVLPRQTEPGVSSPSDVIPSDPTGVTPDRTPLPKSVYRVPKEARTPPLSGFR
jgi:hypothetical protein